jgi:hypothetical protein
MQPVDAAKSDKEQARGTKISRCWRISHGEYMMHISHMLWTKRSLAGRFRVVEPTNPGSSPWLGMCFLMNLFYYLNGAILSMVGAILSVVGDVPVHNEVPTVISSILRIYGLNLSTVLREGCVPVFIGISVCAYLW